MPERYLSFALPDEFVKEFAHIQPNWGFQVGAGNTLGEWTFMTKYSRKKDESIGYEPGDQDYGKKERWYETCRRCVEGYMSILKDHCVYHRTPWNEHKAQRSAKDAYERMFYFKWTPPGRGLANMGTKMVHEENNSATLQNCGFVSTEKISVRSVREATLPFVRLMEMSMNGIGVGFDVRGAGKLTLHEPTDERYIHVIDDTREAWAESLGVLLESYFFENRPTVEFDYSMIRPAGTLLKRYGGTASGPDPLMLMHECIRGILGGRSGEKLSERDIVDINNLSGKAVVAGGARRTAEIALGPPDSDEFLQLKNADVNPERNGVMVNTDGEVVYDEEGNKKWVGDGGWGNLSNNSVLAEVGGNYDHLVPNIAMNGEPGLLYLDLTQQYGRLVDPPNNRDHRVVGVNPCAEQALEHMELCTLVETYPYHHDRYEDYRETLKAAYLYAKAVTLLPTPWPESNEVMQRNRRIGTSVTGVVQFTEERGLQTLREWLDKGYEFVCHRDVIYSEWLGVRESNKKTSVKPSGTTSLLSGTTPGKHFPEFVVYLRRYRLMKLDPMVAIARKAGYHVEPDVTDPKNTVVVTFPARGPDVRSQEQVSVWEKTHLAAMLQRYWADNQVSATLTFREDERDQIGPIINNFDGQLKVMSFLPILEHGAYAQMPYEAITIDEWEALASAARPIDFDAIYDSAESRQAEGEQFCNNDSCVI